MPPTTVELKIEKRLDAIDKHLLRLDRMYRDVARHQEQQEILFREAINVMREVGRTLVRIENFLVRVGGLPDSHETKGK